MWVMEGGVIFRVSWEKELGFFCFKWKYLEGRTLRGAKVGSSLSQDSGTAVP